MERWERMYKLFTVPTVTLRPWRELLRNVPGWLCRSVVGDSGADAYLSSSGCPAEGRRPRMSGSERSQEHPGLLQVGGVKALREPVVDRRQQFARLDPLALLLPQPRQAHGRPQLPGLGLLVLG